MRTRTLSHGLEIEARVHATRIRPDTGAMDRRRLAAATLSAVLPGLGQAFNRRRRLTLLFLIPSLVVIAIGLLLLQLQSPIRLAAWVITPSVLGTVLTLNLLLAIWRLLASVQAFLDTRWSGPTGRLGIIGMAVIVIAIVVPHLMVFQYGRLLGDTFAEIFESQVLAAQNGPDRPDRPAPADGERINVLIIGVDTTDKRSATLTDTMMVASLDPVGGSVSMVSMPRDMVNVPLGNGDVFGPEAQLADVVRGPPPGGVPERRAVGPPGRGRAPCSASRSTTTPRWTCRASSRWSMRSAASTSTSSRASRTRHTTVTAPTSAGSPSRRAATT